MPKTALPAAAALLALLLSGCALSLSATVQEEWHGTHGRTLVVGGCYTEWKDPATGRPQASTAGCPRAVANLTAREPAATFTVPANTTGLSILSHASALAPSVRLTLRWHGADGSTREHVRDFAFGEPEGAPSELDPSTLRRHSRALLSACGAARVEAVLEGMPAGGSSLHAVRVHVADHLGHARAHGAASCNGHWG
jgi:hypothetical protein